MVSESLLKISLKINVDCAYESESFGNDDWLWLVVGNECFLQFIKQFALRRGKCQ